MKKWCLIDEARNIMDLFVYDNKDLAIADAENLWSRLTNSDKMQRTMFLVGLCNVEQNEDGKWDFAENKYGLIDCDIYEVAKNFIE